MKKVLSIVAILLVSLLVVFLIAGLLGPQGMRMERSVEIKAPRNLIFRNISDYTNMNKWSPWLIYDSAMHQEYFGTQGQVGAGYKWKGNDKVGEGEMKTIAIADNDSMTVQLAFHNVNPISVWKLEDAGNGMVKVTWSFAQSFPFLFRPIMLVMNMEKMVGPDYERGLANLKAVCEKEALNSPDMQVKEITWEAHTYVADRSVVAMKDLGKVFMDKMPKTFGYMKENKIQGAEPATGLYYSWDTTAGTTDLAIAIPVTGPAPKVSDGYKVIEVASSRALVVDFYGPYENLKTAHDAIHKYAADKGLKLKYPNIEEYVGDPGVEKDPARVLTKVYYLIED